MLSAVKPDEEKFTLTEMTVKELTEEWLSVVSVKIKESTAANYKTKAINHIIPIFGDIKCCMLKIKDVYLFIEKNLKKVFHCDMLLIL